MFEPVKGRASIKAMFNSPSCGSRVRTVTCARIRY